MKSAKRLTSKCGITIPRDIRTRIGWNPGMGVDLETTEDGNILLHPHVDCCRFCGSADSVRKYKDICVCGKCAEDMMEVLHV